MSLRQKFVGVVNCDAMVFTFCSSLYHDELFLSLDWCFFVLLTDAHPQNTARYFVCVCVGFDRHSIVSHHSILRITMIW